jgi:site-specific DNA-methyltransferase (adenine-specific)
MKKTQMVALFHFPNDDVFKNVQIKGGISYYLLDKIYTGDPIINGKNIDIKKYDIILDHKYYKLIDHMIPHANAALTSLYTSQGSFIDSKLEKVLGDNKCDKSVLCYVSKNKGFIKYIDKTLIKAKYNHWKVITPAAAYKGPSGFSNLFIGSDKEIHSRSYISFKVGTKKEAESLISYLKCKLTHILLSTRKITHNLCNKNIFEWIPLVPLDRTWTDDKIYRYFKLDSNIINLISHTHIDGCYNKEQPEPEQVLPEPEQDLEKKTISQLKQVCKDKGIKGYSGKKKADIIKLIKSSE